MRRGQKVMFWTANRLSPNPPSCFGRQTECQTTFADQKLSILHVQINREHRDSIFLMQLRGSTKVEVQKFTVLMIAYEISWSMPVKDSECTTQDLNLLAILSNRGVYSDFLSLRYIRGNPKYHMGSEPIGKPKLVKETVSLWFKPAWKSSVFSLFIPKPDQAAKSAIVSVITCNELAFPSKNIITSSANIRWEIAISSVFGWYRIIPASNLDWRRQLKTSIAISNR